jgi:uncharacterized iron-regulated membrane protein
MRIIFILLHRWFGLTIAVFLFIAGLTGAIISWDQELDAMIAPEFYYAHGEGTPMTVFEAVHKVELHHPELTVAFFPTTVRQGEAVAAFVKPRKDTDGTTPQADFNQIAINPYTGEIQAKRKWGELSLAPANLLPFIYKLHYSLHIPELGGLDAGVLLMGIIAAVWVLDSVIALWISFPSTRQWRKSFAFRWRSNSQKLTFDLHRSGGVWIWGFLLIMAITSVSMNLGHEVVRPIVNVFSSLTPSPFETQPAVENAVPAISREEAVNLAHTEAAKQGISKPLGGLFYGADKNVYEMWFFEPGHVRGNFGLGNPRFYFDGSDGRYLGSVIPGQGTAGDIFMQLQFPLHSGRILGIGGRIVVTIMGLLVAILSITGIIIWARKRKARLMSSAQKSGPDTIPTITSQAQ